MDRERTLRIEQLPKWLLCIPLVVQWFWLAARYRSLTLPSAIKSIYRHRWTGRRVQGRLPVADLPRICLAHFSLVPRVRQARTPTNFAGNTACTTPLIAKPDIGWCGYGVRRIDNDADLAAYVSAFPRSSAFILQTLVEARNEAGLFFVRSPGAPSGNLKAMTFRHAPEVIGDGASTIASLIAADQRLRQHAKFYAASRGKAALDAIPKPGEHVTLTTIASPPRRRPL